MHDLPLPGPQKRLGKKHASVQTCDGFWLWFMPECATSGTRDETVRFSLQP